LSLAPVKSQEQPLSLVFFSAFFGCFRFNNDQTSKRGSTLRRLKASKACSSSASPCGVVDSGERKTKDGKTGEVLGVFL